MTLENKRKTLENKQKVKQKKQYLHGQYWKLSQSMQTFQDDVFMATYSDKSY